MCLCSFGGLISSHSCGVMVIWLEMLLPSDDLIVSHGASATCNLRVIDIVDLWPPNVSGLVECALAPLVISFALSLILRIS